MLKFSIVVAIDAQNGIGKEGGLPWHIPEDLKYFKKITTATEDPNKKNLVIMGRKTWESIPDKFRPLPGRVNLVLTRNIDLSFPEGVLKTDDLQNVGQVIEAQGLGQDIEQVFVIGGAQIYTQAINMPECHKLYVTEIQQEFECDAFFPSFRDSFEQESSTPVQNYESISYHFSTYIRK